MPDLSPLDAAPAELACDAPITIPCPNCTDSIATTNDPSSSRRCPVCDGDAEVPVHCEACHDPAVRMFEGNPLCMAHFEEWSADALSMAEDVL